MGSEPFLLAVMHRCGLPCNGLLNHALPLNNQRHTALYPFLPLPFEPPPSMLHVCFACFCAARCTACYLLVTLVCQCP